MKIARVDFYLSKEAINDWYYSEAREPGGKKIYSDYVIELCLLMKEFYGLGYRQTQGFISSILSMSGCIELLSPNYTTLSRRCENLSVNLKNKVKFNLNKIRGRKSSLVVAVDSTGLSLYDYSDWHYLKHKQQKTKNIDRWRKLHIAINVDSGEILSAIPSNSKAYDGRYLAPLLDDVDEDIDAICADMAYDNLDCRKIMMQRKAKQLVPPRRKAQKYNESSYYKKVVKDKDILKERDEAIKDIRNNKLQTKDLEKARSLWKKKVGYHQRSLVETTMYQIKAHCGDKLTNKKEKTRNVQSLIKCKVVNLINSALVA